MGSPHVVAFESAPQPEEAAESPRPAGEKMEILGRARGLTAKGGQSWPELTLHLAPLARCSSSFLASGPPECEVRQGKSSGDTQPWVPGRLYHPCARNDHFAAWISRHLWVG